MKQQDAKPEQALPHDLILEGRNRLTATGVRRVSAATQRARPS